MSKRSRDISAARLVGRVLMIDDDPSICMSIQSLLEPYEVEFRSCLGLDEGHELCREWQPEALILDLDFRGQKRGGLDLLAELRAEGFDRPVLIFTSEVNVQNFQEALRYGIFNFLGKPIRKNPFLIALHGALEQQRLSSEARRAQPEGDILGCSPAILELKARIRNVAQLDYPVLITGENGTGKELVCLELKRQGLRRDQPYRVLNCASLRVETIRDELFGHERGAFTGADRARPGMAEEAHGGILFLDEIGQLPYDSQGVLLRFLQEGEIHALGSNRVKHVDVQVICATNENLQERMAAGLFRQDLYERISIFNLHCPPLRERGRDARILAEAFLLQELVARQLPYRPIPEDIYSLLEAYDWPRNVRQLRNVVINLVAHFYNNETRMGSITELLRLLPELKEARCSNGTQPPCGEPGDNSFSPDMVLPYQEAKRVFTRSYFRKVVDALDGNVTAAAKLLDVNPSTVHRAFQEEVEDEERKWGWVR